MTSHEKIEEIVRNSACVIRIGAFQSSIIALSWLKSHLVPVRTTSYTHLRDAFMRALQARMTLGKKNGTISEEDAIVIASPLRKLKSLFPNSPFEKHTPLDIFLSAPSHERQRTLVFRDLGSIENDWVATEFVLHYFEGAGPSPAVRLVYHISPRMLMYLCPQLKKSVVDGLESFQK